MCVCVCVCVCVFLLVDSLRRFLGDSPGGLREASVCEGSPRKEEACVLRCVLFIYLFIYYLFIYHLFKSLLFI